MFVIVQVDVQRDQAVRMIPVQYSIEQEAKAHAEILTSRAANGHKLLRYVVRPLSKLASVVVPPKP